MKNKYNIRFNKSRGQPGRGTEQHVWRVFGDGKEYIVKNVDIQVPSHGEMDQNGGDWNITCEGRLHIDEATSTAIIYELMSYRPTEAVQPRADIRVYDDLISHRTREIVAKLAIQCNYKLGWGDSYSPERKENDYFLHSLLPKEDLEPFFRDLENSELGEELKQYDVSHIVMNLSTPSNSYYSHTHGEEKILLYYVNEDWNQNYHGETLFYKENGKDIEMTVPFIPGRIAFFDGNVPHAVRPPSFAAPQYRFTMAICLKRKR